MKTTLVAELQAEHGKILSSLQSVRNAGLASEQAGELLHKVQVDLIAHLKKEDDLLYPFLRAHASDSETLSGLLSVLSEEMSEISEFVSEFFELFTTSPQSKKLPGLFLQLGNRLFKRIRLEEGTLYPEFERLKGL